MNFLCLSFVQKFRGKCHFFIIFHFKGENNSPLSLEAPIIRDNDLLITYTASNICSQLQLYNERDAKFDHLIILLLVFASLIFVFHRLRDFHSREKENIYLFHVFVKLGHFQSIYLGSLALNFPNTLSIIKIQIHFYFYFHIAYSFLHTIENLSQRVAK